jgi:hypothetical protein
MDAVAYSIFATRDKAPAGYCPTHQIRWPIKHSISPSAVTRPLAFMSELCQSVCGNRIAVLLKQASRLVASKKHLARRRGIPMSAAGHL